MEKVQKRKKQRKSKKVSPNTEIFEELAKGHVPEEIVLLAWKDITQYESNKLGGKNPLITIHSCGVIASSDKTKIDLQQSWALNEVEQIELLNAANLSISLPPGVISKVCRYKLIKVEELD